MERAEVEKSFIPVRLPGMGEMDWLVIYQPNPNYGVYLNSQQVPAGDPKWNSNYTKWFVVKRVGAWKFPMEMTLVEEHHEGTAGMECLFPKSVKAYDACKQMAALGEKT